MLPGAASRKPPVTCPCAILPSACRVQVTLPGGDLEIEWREENNRCYMTGPAEVVFSGEYAL